MIDPTTIAREMIRSGRYEYARNEARLKLDPQLAGTYDPDALRAEAARIFAADVESIVAALHAAVLASESSVHYRESGATGSFRCGVVGGYNSHWWSDVTCRKCINKAAVEPRAD